jgi:hypothetical protein
MAGLQETGEIGTDGEAVDETGQQKNRPHQDGSCKAINLGNADINGAQFSGILRISLGVICHFLTLNQRFIAVALD